MIGGPDESIMELAKAKVDGLIKPIGALGRLEEYYIRLSGIQGTLTPDISQRAVAVFAADNGVLAEDVTPVPQAVTAIQTKNILRGMTGVSALARQAKARVLVTDVGIAAELQHPDLIDQKVRLGTDNIARGPAMSRQEALRAVEVGRETAARLHRDGVTLLGVGEMGIGNTTTASAVLSALTGASPVQTTGRGSGVENEMLRHKVEVVERALKMNRPDPMDPVDVLAKVGGLDIAAMAGCYLGAAELGMPVVADGMISTTAALMACRMDERVKEYLFASHGSPEPGYALAAQALGIAPALELGMRLGEGSGCPLMFILLDMAIAAMLGMATFDQGMIDASVLVDIRPAD